LEFTAFTPAQCGPLKTIGGVARAAGKSATQVPRGDARANVAAMGT
jgi:hypothetical protein